MPETPQPVARPVHPGEMERSVTIREFEQRIATLEQAHNVQVAHVREISEVRATALEKALRLQAEMTAKALELQATEYERRLGELNHAHKTAMENWARSLPREVFEQVEKSWEQWRGEIDAKVLILQQESKDISGLRIDVAALRTKSDQVDVAELKAVVGTLTTKSEQIAGGMLLAKSMGVAGLVALGIALLRLAGVVK